MTNTEWLDGMLNNKVSKEAELVSQGTDAKDHFERKVEAHAWIKEVSELDPVAIEAEYNEKLRQEAKLLGKTAALDDVVADGVTPEEVVNRDYKRDVSSLSDYALAEMLAEARAHEKQSTSEMFWELKEKAKAEVAAGRDKAEKALLDMIPESAQLDWQKAFKEYKKNETPAEPKEKDLFKSDVPEKAHDFQHPSEDKFKLPKDPEKALPGNGREADERKEVTAEPGVEKKDILEGTGKEASLKVQALYPSDFEGREEDPNRIKVFQKDVRIGKSGKITVLGSVMHYTFGPDEWSAYVTTTSYDATGKSNMSSTGAILWSGSFKSKEEAIAALKEWEDINTDGTPQAQASLKEAHCGHCGKEASTPPGFEPVVKELKKDPKVDNPWAVAWYMKNKGDKPHKESDYSGYQKAADGDSEALRAAFKNTMDGAGEEVIIDMLMQYMPEEDMREFLNDFSDEGVWSPGVEDFEQAGIPTAVSKLLVSITKKASACPICGGTGEDLKNKQKEHLACKACGITYAEARLVNKQSSEIKSQACKVEVIQKVAELQKQANPSPWIVTKDETGQDVIARVEHPTNKKESEEDKKDDLLK